MRIVVVHNRYQVAGGEDAVVDAEVNLLTRAGHEVVLYERHNSEISTVATRVQAATSVAWSRRTWLEVTKLCDQFRPDVVHLHNTYPLISGAAIWAADSRKVPVVQTLHNFRLLCANGLFLDGDQVCTRCLDGRIFRAVPKRCYRASTVASLAVASAIGVHKRVKTYDKVTRFIALSSFGKRMFVTGGLPASRIVVKPNHVDDYEVRAPTERRGFLYVGRLSHEKGCQLLVAAARDPEISGQITVAGAGPMEAEIKAAQGIRYVGKLAPAQVSAAMAAATAVVVPSICYEQFGRVVAEAYSVGTPVIAADIGALAEIVEVGRTGWHFKAGDVNDLVRIMKRVQHQRSLLVMQEAAREKFEREFSARGNLDRLTSIYADAVRAREGVC